jgi:hypothetical protein
MRVRILLRSRSPEDGDCGEEGGSGKQGEIWTSKWKGSKPDDCEWKYLSWRDRKWKYGISSVGETILNDEGRWESD